MPSFFISGTADRRSNGLGPERRIGRGASPEDSPLLPASLNLSPAAPSSWLRQWKCLSPWIGRHVAKSAHIVIYTLLLPELSGPSLTEGKNVRSVRGQRPPDGRGVWASANLIISSSSMFFMRQPFRAEARKPRSANYCSSTDDVLGRRLSDSRVDRGIHPDGVCENLKFRQAHPEPQTRPRQIVATQPPLRGVTRKTRLDIRASWLDGRLAQTW